MTAAKQLLWPQRLLTIILVQSKHSEHQESDSQAQEQSCCELIEQESESHSDKQAGWNEQCAAVSHMLFVFRHDNHPRKQHPEGF